MPQKYEDTVCKFAWWTTQNQKASLYISHHKILKVIHNVIDLLAIFVYPLFVHHKLMINGNTHKASLSLNVWFGTSFMPWTGTQDHLTDSVSSYHACWTKTQDVTLSINYGCIFERDIRHGKQHKIYHSETTIWT